MKHSSTKHEYHFFSNPVKVIEHNWSDNTIPMVSVLCVTYNQERYIRDALEGILMQRITFPIKIFVLDDASTDRNVEIIKEYESKYPKLFSCFFLEENTWGKPNRMEMAKPFLDACSEGKYIAMCDGDDYWTDPFKLQKQVDFLEANEDYGLVHSDVDILYDKDQIFVNNYNKKHLININTSNVFEKILSFEYPIQTCTVCFKREFHNKYGENNDTMWSFLIGDTPMWMTIAKHAKIKYMDESMAVRRILVESASHIIDVAKRLEFTKSRFAARFYFIKKYGCLPETEKTVKIKYHKKMLVYSVLLQDIDLAKKSIESLKITRGKVYFYEYLALWRSKFFFLRYVLSPLQRLIKS